MSGFLWVAPRLRIDRVKCLRIAEWRMALRTGRQNLSHPPERGYLSKPRSQERGSTFPPRASWRGRHPSAQANRVLLGTLNKAYLS